MKSLLEELGYRVVAYSDLSMQVYMHGDIVAYLYRYSLRAEWKLSNYATTEFRVIFNKLLEKL